jgi:hypothetical protein
VLAEDDGTISVAGVPEGEIPFVVSAPGFISYFSRFNLNESISEFEWGLIKDAAPFSLPFYRQFVRAGIARRAASFGGFDAGRSRPASTFVP